MVKKERIYSNTVNTKTNELVYSFYDLFIFMYISVLPACVYLYVPHAYLVSVEVRAWWIPCNWSYRWFLSNPGGLGTKSWFSARVATALSSWDISLVPNQHFLLFIFFNFQKKNQAIRIKDRKGMDYCTISAKPTNYKIRLPFSESCSREFTSHWPCLHCCWRMIFMKSEVRTNLEEDIGNE